jgi:hypothetical protein
MLLRWPLPAMRARQEPDPILAHGSGFDAVMPLAVGGHALAAECSPAIVGRAPAAPAWLFTPGGVGVPGKANKCPCLLRWRGGRVAEGGGLLNRRAARKPSADSDLYRKNLVARVKRPSEPAVSVFVSLDTSPGAITRA